MSLRDTIKTTHLTPAAVQARTGSIMQTVLNRSKYLNAPNFTSIHADDLRHFAELYDQQFFGGQLLPLAEKTGIDFRLSQRMTKTGGTTTKRHWRRGVVPTKAQYEIAVSTTLLYQTFRDVERPIMMSGIACNTRLEALQRVMEHELVHLVELLVWDQSSCNATRFHGIANRFFRHTEHKHTLVTQQERAMRRFGIRTGDSVTFQYEGRQLTGFVNRITRRATVLVPDPRGQRFSNGRRYAKYYIPIEKLARVDGDSRLRAARA